MGHPNQAELTRPAPLHCLRASSGRAFPTPEYRVSEGASFLVVMSSSSQSYIQLLWWCGVDSALGYSRVSVLSWTPHDPHRTTRLLLTINGLGISGSVSGSHTAGAALLHRRSWSAPECRVLAAAQQVYGPGHRRCCAWPGSGSPRCPSWT